MHGNYYGTNLEQVLAVRDHLEGKVCIMDIDVKGARDIHGSGLIDCNYIFVKPPSMEVLEQRLTRRKTESREALERRLANARKEIEMAEGSGLYERFIVNDEIEKFL